jgi:rod shape-determining protein MreC
MLGLRRQTFYLLLALSLGHLLLISAQVQSRSGLPVLQAVTFGVFAKVQRALALIADGGHAVWSNYFALRGAVRENAELRRHLLELEGQLQQARAQAATSQALEAALELRQTVAAPTLAARVIAGAPSPGSLTITIDAGADDGVQAEMAVIGKGGVVGRVINRPQPHAAQVQLLVDRTAAAAVFFERTGAGGMVQGGRTDLTLHVELVPNAADIKVGDRVLTSGQDSMYPRGFLVGVVERAERSAAGVWTVSVRPAVDFSHLDIVLVVLAKAARPGGRS